MTPNYVYIDKLADVEPTLAALANELALGVDTETRALPEYSHIKKATLCPHMGRISLLQMCGRDTPVYILDIMALETQGLDWTPLSEFLASRQRLVFANAVFDLKFLLTHTGRLFWNARCVVNLARLLGNATGSKSSKVRGHGLASLLRDYFDIHITGKGEKSEQGSSWSIRPLSEKKLAYAATDVAHLIPLDDLLTATLSNPLPGPSTPAAEAGWGMRGIVNLEMMMLCVSANMEHNGMPVSLEILTDIQRAIDKEYIEITQRLCSIFKLEYDPDPFTAEPILRKASATAINNPESLRLLFKKHLGITLDSAQAGLIRRLNMLLESITYNDEGDMEEGPAFVRDEATIFNEIAYIEAEAQRYNIEALTTLLRYKQLNKQRGMDLRRFINPCTGRIHSSFLQLGAATGRTSSSSPNLQNVGARFHVPIIRPDTNLFPPYGPA